MHRKWVCWTLFMVLHFSAIRRERKEFRAESFSSGAYYQRHERYHFESSDNGCYLENTDAFVDCIVLVAERMVSSCAPDSCWVDQHTTFFQSSGSLNCVWIFCTFLVQFIMFYCSSSKLLADVVWNGYPWERSVFRRWRSATLFWLSSLVARKFFHL